MKTSTVLMLGGAAVAIYYLSKSIGLYDTKILIIIVLAVLQSAFGTYFLASVLTAFPHEILEAARIDGAGSIRILISSGPVKKPDKKKDDKKKDDKPKPTPTKTP